MPTPGMLLASGVPLGHGLLCLLGLIFLGLPLGALAQTLYRIESPDGRVRYSDRPPGPNEKATAQTRGGRLPATTSSSDTVAFELRQLMARFPATLYTSDNCGPCEQGRALLLARGVPYTEYTVTTPQDLQALQRQHGVTSVPLLTLGAQRLHGFLDVEWSQYLDAAGYPKTSKLPGSYRNPAPAPLSPVAPPPTPPLTLSTEPAPINPTQPTLPVSAPAEPDRPASSLPPASTPANPAGIRF